MIEKFSTVHVGIFGHAIQQSKSHQHIEISRNLNIGRLMSTIENITYEI